jgi:N-acetylglutamate synthase-like GNAT family acetyltransferase
MDIRNVTIRKFRTEDANRVSNIIRSNFVEANNKDYPEVTLKLAYDQFTPKYVLTLSNNNKMYVAVEEGTIVGTACIDHDEISNVFVDFQYDGKGIDEMLINLLAEIADNFGLRPVKLVTSTLLQRRYERLGFNLVEDIEIVEFGKQIIMEKYLD